MIKWLGMIFILPLVLFGQQKDKFILKNAGLYLNPEVNGLTTGSPIGQEHSTSKTGISAGFNFEFTLSSKTTLRSGLGIGIKRYNYAQTGLVFGSDIDSTGVISMSRIESEISFKELQLPVVFKFQLKETKFFLATGMEFTYQISNTSNRIIYYGNGKIDKLSNENGHRTKLNFVPLVSFGYQFVCLQHFNISVEAMVKYYLKSYFEPNSNLYNYGLRFTFDLI